VLLRVPGEVKGEEEMTSIDGLRLMDQNLRVTWGGKRGRRNDIHRWVASDGSELVPTTDVDISLPYLPQLSFHTAKPDNLGVSVIAKIRFRLMKTISWEEVPWKQAATFETGTTVENL
jgi:hypothetical protein